MLFFTTFIAMEFMKGFEPLNKFQNDSNYERYKEMALYELDKLHKLRYCHNDFHFQNVMINPRYKYFTTNDDKYMGRALILDFGLSTSVPENVDMENKENRIKLLNHEYGKVNMNIIDKFNALDNKHMIIQSSYIEELEKRLKTNIRDIINSFNIYKGIGGNPIIKSMDKGKDTDEYQENQSKILDDWLKTRPKIKKREVMSDTDDNWYEKLQEKRIIEFEESLKESDPEYYEEFTKKLDELREELDKDADYLYNMIKDALSPPYITENFTFRDTSTESMNNGMKNK
jgi:tRNA A-37 threonylcarbamoyl transferase component Bud32